MKPNMADVVMIAAAHHQIKMSHAGVSRVAAAADRAYAARLFREDAIHAAVDEMLKGLTCRTTEPRLSETEPL